MMMCTDPVVGDILSSWRYDLSGISPDMRKDYEQHFEECAGCRSRQRLHRTIDVTLIGLSTLSALAFLLALAVIRQVEPLRYWALVHLNLHDVDVMHLHLRHRYFEITLHEAAVAGLMVSLLAWLLVALMTPAPTYLTGMAMTQARVLEKELRSRVPRNVA